jgi:hypothetical protein
MDDPILVLLVILAPVLLIVLRVALVPNGITFDDLFHGSDLGWPRGVQEEDSVRWHPERLHPRPR